MRSIFMRLQASSASQHAAADLVALQRLEQRLEVAFAEAVVALALDELEEHRAEQRSARRSAAAGAAGRPRSCRRAGCRAPAARPPARRGRAGAPRASRSRCRWARSSAARRPSAACRPSSSRSSLNSAMCWMPSPLNCIRNSSIWPAALPGFLVERDADHAVGRGHRLGGQAGVFALDVEVADLAEVEQLLVEAGPVRHAAAVDVVRQVVDRASGRGPCGWRSTPGRNSKSMS